MTLPRYQAKGSHALSCSTILRRVMFRRSLSVEFSGGIVIARHTGHCIPFCDLCGAKREVAQMSDRRMANNQRRTLTQSCDSRRGDARRSGSTRCASNPGSLDRRACRSRRCTRPRSPSVTVCVNWRQMSSNTSGRHVSTRVKIQHANACIYIMLLCVLK